LPIDREATLKTAEKLLRQGKLDGAIAEYVRLTEEFPNDWNAVNALGDLYGRAGQVEKAATQFIRIADHLYSEGFMPKAAALYKKVLRIRPEDEHTLLRLADLATRSGVLVDAKNYYRQIADRRRKSGDEKGASEIVIRLGEIDPNDAEAKMQAARTAKAANDIDRASALFVGAVEIYEKQNRGADALNALGEAVANDPDDQALRARLLSGLIANGRVDDAKGVARTPAEFVAISEALERDGKKAEALDVLGQAAELEPDNMQLRTRLARDWVAAGDLDKARQFLSAATAGDDPDLLMTLARIELQAGNLDEGKSVLNRLLAVRPEQRDQLVLVGCELADQGHAEAAFACVDLVADAALLEEDWGGAATALNEFVTRVPNQIPALMKLVEICVDGGLESTMYMAQAQLADAYLAAGKGVEARVIAEDLVAREPWVRANIERFRRALIMLGVEDPDGVIAERLSGESPFQSTIDLKEESKPSVEAPATAEVPPTPAPPPIGSLHAEILDSAFEKDEPALDLADLLPIEPPVEAAPSDPFDFSKHDAEVVIEHVEVDLSDALAGLDAPEEPAPALEDIFDNMRSKGARDAQLQDAQARYAAGIEHASAGRVEEAIAGFEAAARVPMMRFAAGSRLGRLYIAQGELGRGVEWLERAAEAPAPTPEEGHALMFELADALEQMGEHARALAVLLELSADAPDYQDIAERIDRLSKVQTRG
jgi:tetratricopeptide (TPR) repeat protein